MSSTRCQGDAPRALRIDFEVVRGPLVLRVDRRGLAATGAELVGDRLVVVVPATRAPADQVCDEVPRTSERRAVIAVACRHRRAVDRERDGVADAATGEREQHARRLRGS